MKKFGSGLLNKLTSSGKLEQGVLRDDDGDEGYDASLNKSTDELNYEDPTFKKSFSLRNLNLFKSQEIEEDEQDDFSLSKKKSASLRNAATSKSPQLKEPLHESEDKIKKSFSLRSMSFKIPEHLSSDTITKSPSSLKFSASQYKQQQDLSGVDCEDQEILEDADEEGLQAVPKQQRVNPPTFEDFGDDVRVVRVSTPAISLSPPQSMLSLPSHQSPPRVPSSSPSRTSNFVVPSTPPRSASISSSTPPRPAAFSSSSMHDDDFDAHFGARRMRREEANEGADDTLIPTEGQGTSTFGFPFTAKSQKFKF